MTKKNEELDPIAEGRRIQAEAVAAQEEADKTPPTPSQDENDKAKLGLLEDDADDKKAKSEAADKPGSYKTRASDAG